MMKVVPQGRERVTMLSAWSNFYVIVGSSAGALTGLQFVVMTLIRGSDVPKGMTDVRAFGSPTVVQFCFALFVSAAMSAPWRTVTELGACLAVFAAAGIAYSIRVIFHARSAAYTPDTEDWIFYTALPMAAHSVLLVSAIFLWFNPEIALFGIAVTSLAFLFLGLRNSWDTVTYIAVRKNQQENSDKS